VCAYDLVLFLTFVCGSVQWNKRATRKGMCIYRSPVNFLKNKSVSFSEHVKYPVTAIQ